MIQDVSYDLLVDSFRVAFDWIPSLQERDGKKSIEKLWNWGWIVNPAVSSLHMMNSCQSEFLKIYF